MLKGKKVLLGICGSIAAYKAAILTRLLVKAGADVKIVTTAAALDFITPLTLATLSKNPVLTHFTKNETGEWNNHVELGLWADVMIIAPASANTLAKMAQGSCDNLLLAVYLSARCPVLVAPAMDLDMLQHPSTKSNLEKLKQFGNTLIDPNHGELASGLVGHGRMAEPEEILEQVTFFFQQQSVLSGKTVLITAGPTNEPIDPVRFIGNNSSGKMGFAIAEVLANKGAAVTLVTGPTTLHINNPGIRVITVKTAEEMFEACQSIFEKTDISVFSAAVADYRPREAALEKIKKDDNTMTVELVKTVDIAATLGKQKRKGQFTVGFALETENESSNALKKLQSKNLDLIVLNSLRDEGAGFGHDTNRIRIFDKQENVLTFELKTKKEVAEDIVQTIIKKFNA
jgi:phosphopantothenoylcysteine decarboxylase/phosphopantothenate--cysteine ligase